MSRSRWHTARVVGVAGALVLVTPRSARAEPQDAEKRAAAQALFERGRELTKQDNFAEACPKLLESYRLDPAIGTKFYLADCYEHTGRLASAWTYYLEVVDEAHQDSAKGARDREKYAGLRAEALKPRLPQLRVKRSAAARAVGDLVVERDGLRVGEGMYDTPIPVDMGEHVVRASANGKKAIELRVEAKQEGVEVVVEIPALEAVPPPPEPEKAPPPPVEPPPPPPSPALRIAGFTIGAVGVASLGAGIGLGALALSKKNASNGPGNCNAADACSAAGQQLRLDGIRAATGSTALFVVGGAALATGIVLLVVAPSSKPKSQPTPSAEVAFSPFGATLRARF